MSPCKGVVLICCLLYSINGEGPSTDDLVRKQEMCGHDRPYICVKYGKCCSGDEFCHAGVCESCFPAGKTDSDLLQWCRNTEQQNLTSLMRHGSCRLACKFKFKESELSTNVENTESTWMILFIVTFILLVCVVVCVFIIIGLRKKCKLLLKATHVRENEAGHKDEQKRTDQNDEITNLLASNGNTQPPLNTALARSLSRESEHNIRLQILPNVENNVNVQDVSVNGASEQDLPALGSVSSHPDLFNSQPS